MLKDPIQKRGEVMRHLVRFVSDFFGVHGAVPMRVLSIQFARKLDTLGGFQNTIEELVSDGSLKVTMLKSGGRVVSPGGIEVPQGDLTKKA